MAQDLGAAGVMVTPTKEAVPATAATLHAYYAKVAEACPGLPIVLQDHPASTQVHMSADLLIQICQDLPTVQNIKPVPLLHTGCSTGGAPQGHAPRGVAL